MVLATRTSAPNTSLAVIRPKPRPDSPTASEISVIMLKSELPHEAPNPVSKKAAHHFVIAGHNASEDARERAYDTASRVYPSCGAIHPSSQEDGCAGHKRVHARLQRASARA